VAFGGVFLFWGGGGVWCGFRRFCGGRLGGLGFVQKRRFWRMSRPKDWVRWAAPALLRCGEGLLWLKAGLSGEARGEILITLTISP